MATDTSREAYSDALMNGIIEHYSNRTLQVFAANPQKDLTSREFVKEYRIIHGSSISDRDAASTLYNLKNKGQLIITQIRPDSISNVDSEAFMLPPTQPGPFQKKLNYLNRIVERTRELEKAIIKDCGIIVQQASNEPWKSTMITAQNKIDLDKLFKIAQYIKQLYP